MLIIRFIVHIYCFMNRFKYKTEHDTNTKQKTSHLTTAQTALLTVFINFHRTLESLRFTSIEEQP